MVIGGLIPNTLLARLVRAAIYGGLAGFDTALGQQHGLEDVNIANAMTATTPRTLTILRRYGLLAVVGSAAGLAMHVGLVGIDALLVEAPIRMDFDNRFWRSAFSFPFLPILVMEMALTTLTLSMWMRLRRMLHQAHESDMQREHHEATVRTLQRVMALLAQHVARENNQILEEIASRRRRGQQTSQAIEAPTRRIAETLHTLSELSFVAPYLDRPEGEVLDLLQELERRIGSGEPTGPDGCVHQRPSGRDESA